MLVLPMKLQVHPGALEGRDVLRIRRRVIRLPQGEGLPAPRAHGGDQRRVIVVGEIEKRARLPVLLAHEEERHEGGEEHGRRGELLS
jgi:hypothetical protein